MSHASAILTFSLLVTATPAVAGQASKDQTKYCLQVEPSTGSRIVTTECRTKAEWAELGVDVDELLKK